MAHLSKRRGVEAVSTLTIANGAAVSTNDLYFDQGERLGQLVVINTDAALTQTIRLGHSIDGTNFYPVSINGNATAIAAGSVSIFDVPLAGYFRVQTASGNEGAERTFKVYAVAFP